MPVRAGIAPRVLLRPARSYDGRQFHRSARRAAAGKSHYEMLGVPINATAKDIKTSFFTLSKKHHPDHNPNDPDAATRFMKLSEAYSVLSAPAARQRYDHDVLRLHERHAHHPPGASYHSTGHVGGRPASGLSKRRTTFRGPPPSFFRNGGWGAHAEKRRAAQEGPSHASGETGRAEGDAGNAGNAGAGGFPGMGPGQMPFGHEGAEAPHFDRETHFRTHTNHEKRRQAKAAREYVPEGPSPSAWGNFFFVGLIIAVSIVVPSVIFTERKKETRAKPST